MANSAARRAVDPERLTPAAQADELMKLTARLKRLNAMVDELNAAALKRALTTTTNTENTDDTDETRIISSDASAAA